MKLSPPTTPFEGGTSSGTDAWEGIAPAAQPGAMARLRAFVARHAFILLVVLPSLAAAAHYYLVAADQYVSETRYVVRGRSAAPSASLLGGLIGGSGVTMALDEAHTVNNYLMSIDAIRALQPGIDAVAIYQREEADWLARLAYTEPERVLRYWQSMVSINVDTATGVTTLRVRAFRPEDAKALAEGLLHISEGLVNRLSERAREDSLRVAREEVRLAEERVAAARDAITRFRQQERDVDPARSAAMGVEGIAALTGVLTTTRAELEEKSAYMRPDNPQIGVLRNRVAALTQQIAEERRRLTSGGETVLEALAAYERLVLERDFADRQLASATASLEQARVEAQRQQVYLNRIVHPNLAVHPLYPRRAFSVAALFACLAVAYGVGWLLLAGVREHAA
jgi:capsular polysaccharide transport system permease protein